MPFRFHCFQIMTMNENVDEKFIVVALVFEVKDYRAGKKVIGLELEAGKNVFIMEHHHNILISNFLGLGLLCQDTSFFSFDRDFLQGWVS